MTTVWLLLRKVPLADDSDLPSLIPGSPSRVGICLAGAISEPEWLVIKMLW